MDGIKGPTATMDEFWKEIHLNPGPLFLPEFYMVSVEHYLVLYSN